MKVTRRHNSCGGCRYAIFFDGCNTDGVYCPMVACSGGGFKAIYKGYEETGECENRKDRHPLLSHGEVK